MDDKITSTQYRTYLKNKPVVVGPNNEGKLPPQVLELEEAVLGAIMLDRSAFALVAVILQPDSFYKESHILIFTAMKTLFSKAEPIDLLTVTQQLRENGTLEVCGGAYFITQLTERMTSAANVEFHSQIIQEKSMQRKMIMLCNTMIRQCYEEETDVFQAISNHEKSVMDIMVFTKRERRYDDIHQQAINQIEQTMVSGKPLGIQTGYHEFDTVIGGLRPGTVTCIAARPGVGKTAFIVSVLLDMARRGYPCALFSLEMDMLEITKRIMSIQSGVELEYLVKENMPKEKFDSLMANVAKAKDLPLYIDDTPQITVFELRAKARRLKQQYNISVLVVDYLQLMRAHDDTGPKGYSGNREQEISYISRNMKALSKELGIPIIELAQLSRDVEKRGKEMKPRLSDLRESGSIEQDADMVMFLWRPEVHKMYTFEGGGAIPEGYSLGIIEKHRSGALGEVEFYFQKRFSRFVNKSESYHLQTPAPTKYPDPPEKPIQNARQITPVADDDDLPF